MAGHQELHALQAEALRGVLRQQGHLEAAAGHAQLLHGGADPLGQVRRGLLAGPAGLLGQAAPLGLGLRHGPAQGLHVAGGVQRVQRGLPFGAQGRQFLGRAAEAAGQAHPGRETGVQLGQAVRVQLGPGQVGVQAARGVVHLGLGALQGLQHRLDARVEVGHGFQAAQGPAELPAGAGLVLVQALGGLGGGVHQGLAMREALVLGIELGPFLGAGRQAVDLADLPLQALAFAGRSPRARRPGPRWRPSSRRGPGPGRGSTPACSSSRARTAAGRVRPCQACWPWMSTR
jgi:hypothetical protein